MDEVQEYLRLNDAEAYRISFALSNVVWGKVVGWPALAQCTVGRQFIRAIDSMFANIAEKFGRYGKKDKIRFYQTTRGSLFGLLAWNEKARSRQLHTSACYQLIFSELQRLPKVINTLIEHANYPLSYLAVQ